MGTYLINGNKYSLSYEELKQKYGEIRKYSDGEFMTNLPKILHYSCFACWVLGVPSQDCLSDEGLIHQLIHLLAIPDEPLINLKQIREQFNTEMHIITLLN